MLDNDTSASRELFKQHHRKVGTEAYNTAEAERTEKATHVAKIYGESVCFIGTIAMQEGEAISGHDYEPTSPELARVEGEAQKYLDQVPPEEQFVIVEGQLLESPLESREMAIRRHSESGMIQYLCQNQDIPYTSGEPTDARLATMLEKDGVSKTELAALNALRTVSEKIRLSSETDPKAVYDLQFGGDLYYSGVQATLPEFKVYSEKEKQDIQRAGKLDSVMEELSLKSAVIMEAVNNICHANLDGQALFVSHEGNIQINPAINIHDEALREVLHPTPDSPGRIGEVAGQASAVRDLNILETILSARLAGKRPLVVYGGSHFTALDAVLDEMARQRILDFPSK